MLSICKIENKKKEVIELVKTMKLDEAIDTLERWVYYEEMADRPDYNLIGVYEDVLKDLKKLRGDENAK